MGNRQTEPNEIRFDLRRLQRVHAQLPVVVQGKLTDETPFLDPTRAIVLSAHGCLITLSASVRLGEMLILRNVANCEGQDCRVVYLAAVYCECPPETLRIPTKSFHLQNLSRFFYC